MAAAPFQFHFDVQPDDDGSETDEQEMNTAAASAQVPMPSKLRAWLSRPMLMVPFSAMPRQILVDCVPLSGTTDAIYRRSATDVEENAPAGSAVATSLLSQSDLVPGVYEGGVKTWECAYDLAHALLTYLPDDCRHIRVLELGCGSALPGLVALLRGACVYLQDYNDDVLTQVTWPNVLLNCDGRIRTVLDEARSSFTAKKPVWATLPPDAPLDLPVKLVAGSWDALQLEPASFDLILMSETIYDPVHYGTLTALLQRLLKRGGTVLVAAKVYYFGIGGSTAQFRQELQQTGAFTVETIAAQTETVRREIIRATLIL